MWAAVQGSAFGEAQDRMLRGRVSDRVRARHVGGKRAVVDDSA